MRLFEAAGCAIPIISDYWPGLETFFKPDREILIAETPEDTLRFVHDLPDSRRREIGARVTGIDVDPHYLRQARWAAGRLGLEEQIEFRQMQVYDLAHIAEKFDLVLFMGVFYHLRYPLLGLDLVSQKVRRLMVFQTLSMPGEAVREVTQVAHLNDRDALLDPGWPKMAFLEHDFAGDHTNWWAPNRSGVEAMPRSSGMQITGRPENEIYLCTPDPERPSCVSTWNTRELLSATGRTWQEPTELTPYSALDLE